MKKMEHLITIDFCLPSLNEIIADAKRSRYTYGNKKAKMTNAIAASCKGVKPLKNIPFEFYFYWYCKNKRKDPDNISAGGKYIFDGLVKSGVIENDGWRQVKAIKHHFYVSDRNYEYVQVFIKH